MRVLLAMAAAFALSAGCASTPKTEGSAQAAEAQVKTCTMVEVMGQRLPQKVCRTQAQWDAMAK